MKLFEDLSKVVLDDEINTQYISTIPVKITSEQAVFHKSEWKNEM